MLQDENLPTIQESDAGPQSEQKISPQTPPPWQFRMHDLFVVTGAVAVGSAGGHWLSHEIFVGLLGFVMMFVLFALPYWEWIDEEVQRYGWMVLFVVYGSALSSLIISKLTG